MVAMDISFLWKSAYPAYLAAWALVLAWIVATPVLAMQGNPSAYAMYDAGKYICHQKISRSLCLYSTPQWRIGGCTPQNGTFRNDRRSEICADGFGSVGEKCDPNAGFGYKFPVSARDMAIYFGMFLAAAALPLFRKISSMRMPHWLWLAIALAPIALDGTTQLFALRESANTIRFATGILAGTALTFYLIPLLNCAVARKRGEMEEASVDGWRNLAAFLAISFAGYAILLAAMHPGWTFFGL